MGVPGIDLGVHIASQRRIGLLIDAITSFYDSGQQAQCDCDRRGDQCMRRNDGPTIHLLNLLIHATNNGFV